MKKDVFGKGKMAAAAAGLALAFAVGTTGCAAGSKAESGSARAAAANSEEGGADVQKNSQEPENEESREAKLSEYTPVDPASVADSAEEDFMFEDLGDGLISITGYLGEGGQVKIPEKLGGAERIIITSDAFKTNDTITYMYIPKTVTLIEEYSFRDCTALEEVYVGGQVSTIEKSTFRGCTALRRVELAGGVSSIKGEMDSGAFQDCTSLTEVVFPDTFNDRIDTNAFYGCTALETVDLSGTQLLGIGQLAFGYCENLKTVKLPATVQWVESNSFLATPSLEEFTIEDGNSVLETEDGVVYTIDFCGPESPNVALFGLEGAAGEDVAIREGTEKIAGHSFSHNHTIQTLKLPDSVKEIDSRAFSDCASLTQVDFGTGLEEIKDHGFENCTSLEEIELPASLTKLGDGSFSFCGLKKAALPDGVKYSSGSTTQKYVFAGNEDAVFTYQGQEYTYNQAAQLDSFLMK